MFNKGTVSLPIRSIELPQPTGYQQNIEDNDDSHRKFGAFIITHGCPQ